MNYNSQAKAYKRDMTCVNISAYKDIDDTPLLVLVDLQREYLCADRRLGLHAPEAAIKNCTVLVEWARSCRIPIAFVRWTQPGKLFSRGGDFSGWIEPCSPAGSDMIFERAWPSCYASAEFAQMMENGGGRNAILAGFTGSMACLATVVDGAQRQHRFTFVSDASLSHAIRDHGQLQVHAMATLLISQFAHVVQTSLLLADNAQFSSIAEQFEG